MKTNQHHTPHTGDHLDDLRSLLTRHQEGAIRDATELERRLAAAWDDLVGDDGGMRGEKLIGRTEGMTWQPPTLRFRIERHGATVQGSSRAEVQDWAVNLDRATKSLVATGRRQVRPAQPKADVTAVASEIAAAVTSGQEDMRLRWDGKDRVRLLTGTVFPTRSAAKETLAGRRKRLRTALVGLLAPAGWQMVRANLFEREVTRAGG